MKKLSGIILLTIVIFTGCRSMPALLPADKRITWLPADSKVFLNVNIDGNRELFNRTITKMGIDNKDLQSIIDRSHTVCLGLENPLDLADPGIHMISEGEYNSGMMKLGLRVSKDWAQTDRESGTITNAEAGIQIVPEKGKILFSEGKIDEILTNRVDPVPVYLPRDVRDHFIESDIILYYPQPSRDVLTALSPNLADLEVDLFYISMNKVEPVAEGEEPEYEIMGLVRMKDITKTRPFSTALKWVILGVVVSSENPDTKQFLKTIKIDTQWNDVELSGLNLSLEMASDMISNVIKLDIYEK
ncbi:hypothetical protein [Spirochaeta isovalerica]|uniref:Lipoprotein n=1 Tax=Spirochaeta isovalerica TaxID=150 RepID=A0A841RC14_9SPIO|nr:hypothetical protein [Spirochaeta isovalerica]MBB6480767.1 hypothetical protein [Spirochaeta isovalerica]